MHPDERIIYGVEVPHFISLGLIGRSMVKIMMAVSRGVLFILACLSLHVAPCCLQSVGLVILT